jgi:hypothetical protein
MCSVPSKIGSWVFVDDPFPHPTGTTIETHRTVGIEPVERTRTMKTIRQSTIGQFLKCGEQYKRRWVLNDKIPPGVAMLKGTSFHKGAEENFKSKIVTGADLSPNAVTEIAVETFRQNVSTEGLLLSREEETVGRENVVNQAEKSLVTLTSLFSRDIAPKHDPLHTEMQLAADIPGSDYQLTGRIDLVNTKIRIVDFKTSKKSPNKGTADTNIQFTVYGLLFQASTGKQPAGYDLEYAIDGNNPKTVCQTTTRAPEDFVALIRQIDQITKSIDAEVFPPAYGQMGAWWCSPKWCGYHSTCPAVPESKRGKE